MSEPPLCEHLEWDTKFFGVRIGRVRARTLSEHDLKRSLDWVGREKVDCLYFLCDAADAQCIARVQRAGFLFTDVRLTFETIINPTIGLGAEDGRIRPTRNGDVPALKAIASISHENTRFYADGNFPRERCAALYETWIEKSCSGPEEVVFVATAADGRVAGYVSCHKRENARGEIGLIAVAPEFRGQGLSARLIRSALNWFSSQGCRKASVVTQANNIAAQRLYQKTEFVAAESQVWFHFWAGRATAPPLK